MEHETDSDVLDRAEARCPGNPFVASCREHSERYGLLSEKQIAALERVHAYRPAPSRGPKRETQEMAYLRGLDVDECYEQFSGANGNLNGDY